MKILDMENVEDDSATLEAFRLDVATFRKTRHENVILFMGACMNPPKLAIVTSLCKGILNEAYNNNTGCLVSYWGFCQGPENNQRLMILVLTFNIEHVQKVWNLILYCWFYI